MLDTVKQQKVLLLLPNKVDHCSQAHTFVSVACSKTLLPRSKKNPLRRLRRRRAPRRAAASRRPPSPPPLADEGPLHPTEVTWESQRRARGAQPATSSRPAVLPRRQASSRTLPRQVPPFLRPRLLFLVTLEC